MPNSDVIVPHHVSAEPGTRFSRADDGAMKHAIARYAQRLPNNSAEIAGLGALSLHELRGLEDDVQSALDRGLRGDQLRDSARKARIKREAALDDSLMACAGRARDQQLPQLRAELAVVPSFDAVAEREVRDRIWSLAPDQREQFVRDSDNAIVLAAVLHSPLPLVSDRTRTMLLDMFNRTQRPELVEQLDAVETFLGTAEEIVDMVRRTFNEIAPR
jgi:hypothetical protein